MAPLKDEIKKRRPFELLEQEVVLNLLRTNDQVQIHFDRLFRQHGLNSSSQYNILRILRGEGKPMESLEIARRTVTVVPGITGLIDRLEKAGLVQRKRSADDRRKVFVAITREGLDLLAEIDQPLLDLHRQVVGHMTREELHELNRLLEKARQSCPKERR